MLEPGSRLRLRERVRRHPVLAAAGGSVVVIGILVVLVWFQPQTLLFDRVVDEQFPVAAAPEQPTEAADQDPASGIDDAEPAEAPEVDEGETDERQPPREEDPEAEAAARDAADPVGLASGSFSSRGRYSVVGTATTYELADGSRVLRLEDFESTNGPDLFVYLTVGNEADDDDVLGADVVDLGVLSGNVGNQHYAIPADVDLDRYDTVVIWCRRFTVGFGAADLHPT